MRNLLGVKYERDRLFLPGLRTLHEVPSPRRILLRQEVGDFFLFVKILFVLTSTFYFKEWHFFKIPAWNKCFNLQGQLMGFNTGGF